MCAGAGAAAAAAARTAGARLARAYPRPRAFLVQSRGRRLRVQEAGLQRRLGDQAAEPAAGGERERQPDQHHEDGDDACGNPRAQALVAATVLAVLPPTNVVVIEAP